MPTLLTLRTARRDDGTPVLIATGEIDLSNVDDFEKALSTAAAGAVRQGATLTVDLSAVEYLDSSAINVLYAEARNIETVIAHPLLVTILEVSGLSQLVAVESPPSVAER
ncbi:anti-anti-sigma regulatory factor (antagonist of anti-sigma factor) [Mycolicibacterium chubuense NBB4]|uniref:Anti-anti-sigma regulatory factor (Antagonist of anti-sigma factor) n=1 Tax=Mycolicibacterium chubuense (strain NBB4) TaxID=710421 RepID=I4BLU7_MYCCN|nr:STAS domain-containing protein [Mycolicibacterium chubuense]AFM18254.1 anti-anti-sigma regulatory factor (antagonist of anti-sigma factor) [Mycolicibacterium chubuense NBB4]